MTERSTLNVQRSTLNVQVLQAMQEEGGGGKTSRKTM